MLRAVQQIRLNFIKLRFYYSLLIVISTLAILVWFQVYQSNTAINNSLVPVVAEITAVKNSYLQCTRGEYGCDRQYCACWSHYLTVTYRALAQPPVRNNNDQVVEMLMGTDLYPILGYSSITEGINVNGGGDFVVGASVTGYYNICPLGPIKLADQLACNEHNNDQLFYWSLVSDPVAYAATFFLVAVAGALFLTGLYYNIKCCWRCCRRDNDVEDCQQPDYQADHNLELVIVMEQLPAYSAVVELAQSQPPPEEPPEYDLARLSSDNPPPEYPT